MAEAISNTSPLLYLHRVGALQWLGTLFDNVWVPGAVTDELKEGQRKGHDVPDPTIYPWVHLVDPEFTPSEWLALDLGTGELAAMALALENPTRVVLLDDALARRTAQAAGIAVRGTLGITAVTVPPMAIAANGPAEPGTVVVNVRYNKPPDIAPCHIGPEDCYPYRSPAWITVSDNGETIIDMANKFLGITSRAPVSSRNPAFYPPSN
mgnify:CR=1 FL=1